MAAAEYELGQHLHRSGHKLDVVAHFKQAHLLDPKNWSYPRNAFSIVEREEMETPTAPISSRKWPGSVRTPSTPSSRYSVGRARGKARPPPPRDVERLATLWDSIYGGRVLDEGGLCPQHSVSEYSMTCQKGLRFWTQHPTLAPVGYRRGVRPGSDRPR